MSSTLEATGRERLLGKCRRRRPCLCAQRRHHPPITIKPGWFCPEFAHQWKVGYSSRSRCNMLVEPEEIGRRKADGSPAVPADATPWQMLYRRTVTQLSDGAVIEGAPEFSKLAEKLPRHNH
ncbi:hypothetical protein QO002_005820 [Pararhizobium capsulatum DSM 1112]|uniref:Uncharacterized protein n=1 Tax=Pararhizobium capsulatum DSM 1112 TaxID=1121113 RepID=A0ABU0BZE6_9HYPH|nr:hypothetical protein [Pararhizobium capsulatum DSM 1112]